MSNGQGKDHAKNPSGGGQQKVHTATRTNPETGQQETRQFTQEEWRNRNKSEGWTRPDGEEGEDSGGTDTGGTV